MSVIWCRSDNRGCSCNSWVHLHRGKSACQDHLVIYTYIQNNISNNQTLIWCDVFLCGWLAFTHRRQGRLWAGLTLRKCSVRRRWCAPCQHLLHLNCRSYTPCEQRRSHCVSARREANPTFNSNLIISVEFDYLPLPHWLILTFPITILNV